MTAKYLGVYSTERVAACARVRWGPPAYPTRIDRTAGLWACHLWTGATNGLYGRIRINGKQVFVHRLALEEKLGRPLLPGMFACHTCDTPLCCNPLHLFEGTQTDNMRDARDKMRVGAWTHPEKVIRGEKHYKSILTDRQFDEIRRRVVAGGTTQTALAREYGVSIQVINHRLARLGLTGRRAA